MKLNPTETIKIQRGMVLAAIEFIGSVGTGQLPFKQVAELVAALQEAAKAPAVAELVDEDDGT